MVGRRSSAHDVTPTQLGMLLGIVIGAAIGVVLFAVTTDALWLTLPGVGVALGLGLGATVDHRGSDDAKRR
jgi:uncharacterized membrane protein YccC